MITFCTSIKTNMSICTRDK